MHPFWGRELLKRRALSADSYEFSKRNWFEIFVFLALFAIFLIKLYYQFPIRFANGFRLFAQQLRTEWKALCPACRGV